MEKCRWIMGHTHLNTIVTSSPCNYDKRKYKNRTDAVSPWMLIQPYTKGFFEGDKNVNSLTWPDLKNQQLLKHLHPSIATVLGHLGQEHKNFQSTNQFRSELEIE